GLGQRIGRGREAGVVEQEVDVAPRGRQPGETLDRGAIAHVDLELQERVAELLLKLTQPLGATAGADDVPAAADEAPGGSLAEARGCSRDQDRLTHWSPLAAQSAAARRRARRP